MKKNSNTKIKWNMTQIVGSHLLLKCVFKKHVMCCNFDLNCATENSCQWKTQNNCHVICFSWHSKSMKSNCKMTTYFAFLCFFFFTPFQHLNCYNVRAGPEGGWIEKNLFLKKRHFRERDSYSRRERGKLFLTSDKLFWFPQA